MIETDAKTRLIYAESRRNMQRALQEFTLYGVASGVEAAHEEANRVSRARIYRPKTIEWCVHVFGDHPSAANL